MALKLNLRVSASAHAQLSYILTCAYHMEEVTCKVLHIYRSCFILKIGPRGWKGSVLYGCRGRHFFPSQPGDGYLKLGSKSDLRAEVSGSILWYKALVPRPEVLRLISSFYGNFGSPVLWLFHTYENWSFHHSLWKNMRAYLYILIRNI